MLGVYGVCTGDGVRRWGRSSGLEALHATQPLPAAGAGLTGRSSPGSALQGAGWLQPRPLLASLAVGSSGSSTHTWL
jgi:hypothetical protein